MLWSGLRELGMCMALTRLIMGNVEMWRSGQGVGELVIFITSGSGVIML